MRIETTKKLILTKAEQKTIHDLYNILNKDSSIDCNEVWDILFDISTGGEGVAQEYGYDIEIRD